MNGRPPPAARPDPTRMALGLLRPRPTGTSAKIFMVFVLALLPLGIIAVLGVIQAFRTADEERAARLALVTERAANSLTNGLVSDRRVMWVLVNAMAGNRGGADICQRAAQSLSLPATDRGIRFAVYDRGGRRLCRNLGHGMPDVPPQHRFLRVETSIDPAGERLLLRSRSVDLSLVAITSYTRQDLARMLGPAGTQADGAMTLKAVGGSLPLSRALAPSGERLRSTAALPLVGLTLQQEVTETPLGLSRTVLLLLPLLLWLLAASLGWLVVHRLLIAPVVSLQHTVARYTPGRPLAGRPERSQLFEELNVLGDTFEAISRDVATHEARMAQGLETQRSLTREVHHRVKNNLQIIASLVSLHSRAATTREAAMAYASIQRRVDALAVVHRNHFAAAEGLAGIDAAAMLSELTGALRASSSEAGGHFNLKVAADHVMLAQDNAVPLAFIVTELVELAMLVEGNGMALVALRASPDQPVARLVIESGALVGSDQLDMLLSERFGRVLTGLGRQLRTVPDWNREQGRFTIDIPIMPRLPSGREDGAAQPDEAVRAAP